MAGGETEGRELLRLLAGPWLTEAVVTAVRLGVIDRLGDGPETPAETAAALSLRPEPLARVLRLLTAAGVLSEDGGRYALTEMGEQLHSDHPASMRPLALLYNSDFFTRAWRGLSEAVRTGEPAFRSVHRQGIYAYLADHPDDEALFDAGMAAGSSFAAGLPAAYDFSAAKKVVDVGGGDGTLLAAVLRAYPHLRGILFERPPALHGARERLAPHIAEGRCDLVEGDFMREIPDDGDVYILCRVLHNWDDEACHLLLANCRAAMGPDARLLVVERVIPDGRHPLLTLAFDVHMMVMTSGRERTASEYEALLRPVGLTTADITDLAAEMRLLTARPR
ncbi:methyltransferase [Nocardiopsis rhodophaea]|uniref:Methyltransferase n=1 Tax=Nocardiopsis rhodophaea TaxID=280238 RepID=A0ABN2TKM5_9ACTN